MLQERAWMMVTALHFTKLLKEKILLISLTQITARGLAHQLDFTCGLPTIRFSHGKTSE